MVWMGMRGEGWRAKKEVTFTLITTFPGLEILLSYHRFACSFDLQKLSQVEILSLSGMSPLHLIETREIKGVPHTVILFESQTAHLDLLLPEVVQHFQGKRTHTICCV